jgi:hypothetical protein
MATMAAIRTQNATTSTALAINKATEIFNDTQTLNCKMQLRLTNLEKNFHRQEQKTNEINNKINKKQKNANGSRPQEPTTSQFPKGSHPPTKQQKITIGRPNNGTKRGTNNKQTSTSSKSLRSN